MAFFDKLSDLAKTASEKTSNAIESGKLHAKISAEERNITTITAKIGAYYLSKLDEGEELDEKVMNMYQGILDSRAVIEATKADLEVLNGPKASEDEAEEPSEDSGAEQNPETEA